MPSTLSDKARDALLEIRNSIVNAQIFISGLTSEDFEKSHLHFYATTRALEIISEASRRLPEHLRAKYASLPWQDIMSAGNVNRHEYDHVSPAMVWNTTHDSLPALLAAVEAELDVHSRA